MKLPLFHPKTESTIPRSLMVTAGPFSTPTINSQQRVLLRLSTPSYRELEVREDAIPTFPRRNGLHICESRVVLGLCSESVPHRNAVLAAFAEPLSSLCLVWRESRCVDIYIWCSFPNFTSSSSSASSASSVSSVSSVSSASLCCIATQLAGYLVSLCCCSYASPSFLAIDNRRSFGIRDTQALLACRYLSESWDF
jgi:hypothetical protein